MTSSALTKTRLETIDIVRGLAMVLMCLDHVRDFFGDIFDSPEKMESTRAALFTTRWVTHFCAPAFLFLAGVSAFLASTRRTPAERTRFLLTRGLWLMLLELTLVNGGWLLMAPFRVLFFQVIWVIGLSFLALALLSHLPRPVPLLVGLACVVGQHFIPVDALTSSNQWFAILYGQTVYFANPLREAAPSLVMINYSLLPWLGVMLLGYGLAPLFQEERAERRSKLIRLGLGTLAAFVLVRLFSGFGNIEGWSFADHTQALSAAGREGWAMHLIAFLNASKYPPSLAYITMTLGPTFLLLAYFDREVGAAGKRMLVFGRVPLLYYVVHLYVAQLGAGLLHRVEYGSWLFPFRAMFTTGQWSSEKGHGLLVVYLAWIACLVVLYPLCVQFGKWKRNGKSWVWSYL